MLLFLTLAAAHTAAADAITHQNTAEEAAIRAAVERVSPSVVRLETVGGLEKAEGITFGEGATSGLIVDDQGYIVSSEFNFLCRPDSILVQLPDGSRKAAQLVATDHSRGIVLLKIKLNENERRVMKVPEIVDHGQIRVGQWAIAVGRVFDVDRPNICVGIVSAKNRIHGKAIQTDADTSPNNYGGPLVDIGGRVMGLLVPLAPGGDLNADALALYDSGIGFAIPAADVLRSVERLKKGRDLYDGFLGVCFKGSNPIISEPIVAACLKGSPADRAGLRLGDRILEIDGRLITRAIDVSEAVARCYAGDRVNVTYQRDGQQFRAEMELIAASQTAKQVTK